MEQVEKILPQLLKYNCISEIKNRVLEGDALNTLRHFPSNSIDCVVTSPPYYLTRDYRIQGQIGRESTIANYIDSLIRVFGQVKRVLTPEGNCWINIGDKIADKEYLLIPEQFALAMVDIGGWKLVDKIIWHKPNVLPGTSKKRYTINHEYVYRFVKSDLFYFKPQYDKLAEVTVKEINKAYNGKAVKDYANAGAPDPSDAKRSIIDTFQNKYKFGGNRAKEYGNTAYSGEGWIPSTIILSAHDERMAKKLGWDGVMDYAEWYFTKRPKKGYHDHSQDKTMGMMQRGHGKVPLAYPYGCLKRSIWKIAHGSYKNNHFAVFPDKLVEECLSSGCPSSVAYQENASVRKGIVLDCFMGAGTVGTVAVRKGIDFIGIELSPEYVRLAKDRIVAEYAKIYSKVIKDGL